VLFLSGCASLSPDFDEPTVEVISIKALPAKGFEQNFELPFNGISCELSVAGPTLARGVTADIPTAGAYGEARFVVPVSTSVIGGFKVIKALMDNQGQGISYQLKAKLDIDIAFVPKLTIIQDGMVPMGQQPQ
jgi:hypothetical protein